MKKLITFAAVLWAVSLTALAQNPVTITAKLDAEQLKPGQKARVTVAVKLDAGWHLYALTQPPPPRAAKLVVDESGAFKADGAVQQQPKPKVYQDPNFTMPGEPPFMSQAYDGEANFIAPVKVKDDAPVGPQKLTVKFSYQVCDDHTCLRPTTKAFDLDAVILGAGAKLAASPSPSASPKASPTAAPEASPSPSPTGETVVADATPPPAPPAVASAAVEEDLSKSLKNRGLLGFIWFALLQGFLALLTPCVFPMIPITVSFFTKREKSTSAQAIGQASFFSVGIILTYTLLGLALVLIAGPTGLTKLAASPWMNLFLTALFVVFALNLFGMFEIRVPSGLISKLDAQASSKQGGNTLATILMGITFTLTSFTCTTAFVGTVLIYATRGDWFWAVVGMLAFATAFALPFFLFALFPQWLSSLPKSGGWLNSVKVVMGFLEIGAAFKFLSNVDLVWGWQTVSRNLVLSAWIALALVAALYLLGKVRLPHDTPVESLGVPRMLLATFFFAVAFYLLTGLFGAPLGELDAWLPPPSATASASANGATKNAVSWLESYDAAIQKARTENRPVLLNFTGVTCTNCRWMEQNMFTDPAIRKELDRFVLAELYTDRETPEHQKGDEFNGQLQTEKFGTAALPLYAIVDPAGNLLAKFPGLTRDKQEFLGFLQRGAGRYAPATAKN